MLHCSSNNWVNSVEIWNVVDAKRAHLILYSTFAFGYFLDIASNKYRQYEQQREK